MSARPPGAVLLLHGAGAGGWEWTVWSRVLSARGWTVSAPDLQPASAGLAATRFADYLAQAHAAGAALPRPLAVAGASLGGLLALATCAALQPQALLLVNPLPPAPLHARLPRRRARGMVVPWGRDASLAGTRRALPDADDAACLFAFRRWRDESQAVLDQAFDGVEVERPHCAVRVLASVDDASVPPALSAELARWLSAGCERLPGTSHVGALLGRGAARIAADAERWLRASVQRQP